MTLLIPSHVPMEVEAALGLLGLHPSLNQLPQKRNYEQAVLDVVADDESNATIRCICGFSHDDGFSIACDTCGRWVHSACFDITRETVPNEWWCWECRPRYVDRDKANRLQRELLGIGIGLGNKTKKTKGKRRNSVMVNPEPVVAHQEPMVPQESPVDPPDFVPIEQDVVADDDTQDKLRRQARQWRGVTAISPATPQTCLNPEEPISDPSSTLSLAVDHSVRPPSYSLHTTCPIPSEQLIAPYKSIITPSSAYLSNPINAYAHMGMPKTFVHLMGPPLDLTLDARVLGNESRYARSGCRPNAVLRPLICSDNPDTLSFGVFALRDLKANEEVVLGWEWDDGHAVHNLPAIISTPNIFKPDQVHHIHQQMTSILHSLSSAFVTCACGHKATDCALSRMAEFVDNDSNLPPASPTPSSSVDLGPLVGAERGFRTRERIPGSGGMAGVEMSSSEEPPLSPQDIEYEDRSLHTRLRRRWRQTARPHESRSPVPPPPPTLITPSVPFSKLSLLSPIVPTVSGPPQTTPPKKRRKTRKKDDRKQIRKQPSPVVEWEPIRREEPESVNEGDLEMTEVDVDGDVEMNAIPPQAPPHSPPPPLSLSPPRPEAEPGPPPDPEPLPEPLPHRISPEVQAVMEVDEELPPQEEVPEDGQVIEPVSPVPEEIFAERPSPASPSPSPEQPEFISPAPEEPTEPPVPAAEPITEAVVREPTPPPPPPPPKKKLGLKEYAARRRKQKEQEESELAEQRAQIVESTEDKPPETSNAETSPAPLPKRDESSPARIPVPLPKQERSTSPTTTSPFRPRQEESKQEAKTPTPVTLDDPASRLVAILKAAVNQPSHSNGNGILASLSPPAFKQTRSESCQAVPGVSMNGASSSTSPEPHEEGEIITPYRRTYPKLHGPHSVRSLLNPMPLNHTNRIPPSPPTQPRSMVNNPPLLPPPLGPRPPLHDKPVPSAPRALRMGGASQQGRRFGLGGGDRGPGAGYSDDRNYNPQHWRPNNNGNANSSGWGGNR